jgi:hypothetical protein
VTFSSKSGPLKSRKNGKIDLTEEDFDMKKTKYTEEQIACALKQAETGTRVQEVIRGKWAFQSKRSTTGRRSTEGWAYRCSRDLSSKKKKTLD